MNNNKNIYIYILFLSLYMMSVNELYAGGADILNVDIKNEGNERFTFNVTLQHDDTGWDHYADRWEILTPEGEIIAIRVLRHPHTKKKPFTRSLPYVPVPSEINNVIIRAHCSVDEFGGEEVSINIPR